MPTVMSSGDPVESSGHTLPAQAMLGSENATIEHSENDASIATNFFKEAWNRLSSTFQPRQHVTDEDQTRRGENTISSQSTVPDVEANHGEIAVAGATSPNGPHVETTDNRQDSPFSSTAFDQLPQPVPVVDIFLGSWWLVSALRTLTRPVVIYLSTFWIWTSFPTLPLVVLLPIYMIRWALLKTGHDTIPLLGVPIPGKLQLFSALIRSTQKYWVTHCLGLLDYRDR